MSAAGYKPPQSTPNNLVFDHCLKLVYTSHICLCRWS